MCTLVRAQEQDHVADVLGRDEGLHSRVADRVLAHLILRPAAGFGFGLDHALDAVALDRTGTDAVDADTEWTQLQRQGLGEADDRPLRRGVWRTTREAVNAGR